MCACVFVYVCVCICVYHCRYIIHGYIHSFRLMCVLLQSLHMHLSSRELEEITSLLEQSATESQENNNIVPFLTQKIINQPVPLTDIPKVR